ncbi:MAG: acyl-CoA N-acyltransferase [Candidatus Riflebacteria bacterium]|nr:acyl-CoA N-acyltransferase [Candidatus Riflebacteria bacterium]
MGAVEVAPVRGRADLTAFVELPWALYKGDPSWVPPIRSDVSTLLTPGEHPFWAHGQRELFLARRDGEVVGRIAAIVDGSYNAFHAEKMGSFGFFESRNDPEVAMALFAAAEAWLGDRGMEFVRGPLNPSTNYEVGLLVQGFRSPPTLMMTYNPPYYAELVFLCGFRKEKDLLAFLYRPGASLPAWALEVSGRLREKGEVTIRTANRRDLDADLKLMNRIYTECWSRNWGFVPMTEEEIVASSGTLKHIVDPDLAFFLCYRDEPVGVCLILPDVNPLLKRFDGTLGILAYIKLHLYWSSDVTGARGLLFGVREEYRQMGLPLVAFAYLHEVFSRKPQYRYVEVGWNLEDNDSINALYREGGLEPHKRYRIYRKELPPRPAPGR